MAFFDKLNDFAKNIGDKTTDAIETGKLNSKINAENTAAGEELKKIGAYYYNLFIAGDENKAVAPEVLEFCQNAKAHYEAAAAAQAAAREAQGSGDSQYSIPVITGDSSMGVAVAEYACQFVGNPYVYGGTSLTNGADCSGFVMRIYADFGYSIPRTADVQGTVGTEVSLSALAPGDLVFYDNGTGSIKHVAMYIGNGQVVHASSSTTGIIISNTNYKPPCKAVRIIN